MKHYAVIGCPLKFCLSAPVFNGAFKALALEAECQTREVTPEELSAVVTELKQGALNGLVLTRPHKTPILPYLDEVSEEAKILDAVNEVVRLEDGRLKGDNTDWMGVVAACQTVIPGLSGKSVLILGAGGAARAAVYGLKKAGATVALWNRNPERAKSFAEKMDVEWVSDLAYWEGSPEIILNATDATHGEKQSTLVPFKLWGRVNLALDVVYGKTSLFLEEAKAAQVPHTLSGEVWFLEQVERVFEFLTGQSPPKELMEQLTHEAKEIRV